MRKIISYLIVGAMLGMALAGCAGKKTIPDDTLSDIFRDIYLSNAYVDRTPGRLDFDSVNIYEPILNSYGYTSEDFIHTIGNFSKRKSSRISDIVDDAVQKLEDMSAVLTRKVSILDKIDSTAFERTKKIIYTDSLIEVRSLADTSKIYITIPAANPGSYGISFYYYQDHTDPNSLSSRFIFRDSLGVQVSTSTNYIRTSSRQLYTTKLEKQPRGRKLELRLANYPPTPKTPMHIDFDSLVVVHYLPKEEALEKLLRSYIDYTLIIDGRPYYEYYNLPADSSTLHILPPLAPEKPDTVAVE